MSTAWQNPATSKLASSPRNVIRLRLAKLHAELSRCTYSLHGLDPLMRPDSGHVCQRYIVVSYWSPGSAHSHAASAIWWSRSRAGRTDNVSPDMTAWRSQ